MTKIFCLVALCLSAVTGLPAPERIVNGQLTSINQYPFMAVVLITFNNINLEHSCGGVIINNRSVLSAAHCFIISTTGLYRLRVGSTFAHSGGTVHALSRIINHPNYSSLTFENDIGVLRVSRAFSFGPNIRVGHIASPNYNAGDNAAVWAVGWGRISTTGPYSEQLRHVQIRTINQNTCARNYYGSQLKSSMLCAGGGGHGACSGDSGGPLIHNNVVIGITSFSDPPCGGPPDVFTRVSSYTNWIEINV